MIYYFLAGYLIVVLITIFLGTFAFLAPNFMAKLMSKKYLVKNPIIVPGQKWLISGIGEVFVYDIKYDSWCIKRLDRIFYKTINGEVYWTTREDFVDASMSVIKEESEAEKGSLSLCQ